MCPTCGQRLDSLHFRYIAQIFLSYPVLHGLPKNLGRDENHFLEDLKKYAVLVPQNDFKINYTKLAKINSKVRTFWHPSFSKNILVIGTRNPA